MKQMESLCPLPQVGDRIELVDMPDDPWPVPVGTKGTVRSINRRVNQIDVKWDYNSSLFLMIGTDRWKILDEDDGSAA